MHHLAEDAKQVSRADENAYNHIIIKLRYIKMVTLQTTQFTPDINLEALMYTTGIYFNTDYVYIYYVSFCVCVCE